MVVGIPVTFSFQGTNFKDPVPTLDELLLNCQAPVFAEGLEVQDTDSIWKYSDEISYTPRTWTAKAEEDGIYSEDEILWVRCDGKDGDNKPLPADLIKYKGKLIKVTGKTGAGFVYHKRPLEPEEYKKWDTVWDASQWKERYLRVPAFTISACYANRFNSPSGSRAYTLCYDYRCIGGQSKRSWVFVASEATKNNPNLNVPCVRKTIPHVTGKYDAAGDVKASVVKWGWNRPAEDTILIKSIITRGGFVYFRTNINKPLEYANWRTGPGYDYSYGEVVSPADIDGFARDRMNMQMAPLDGKNYTTCYIDTKDIGGYASFDLINNEPFDTIALGNLRCDKVDITVVDEDGRLWSEVLGYPIDNSIGYNIPLPKDDKPIDPNNGSVIDDAGFKVSQTETTMEIGVTRTIYMEKYIPEQCRVNIKIYGDIIEVGEIVGADSIDAGFTKVAFKNTLKDFSPKEQDQWGNWEYVDGIRVKVHTGTVEFPIMRYDQMNKLMMLLGGNKVVVNSSDSYNNEVPDSKNVFGATMIIGRFTRFELSTKEVNKRIGERGVYNFAIEEMV